ncbi:MAG: hypothetical protein LBR41_02735 [Rickettsiales bacterium]|jgi:hypothetical protein|nr:hypothetical protein [Rickettsiales bacterium]
MARALPPLLKDRSLENNIIAEVAEWNGEYGWGGNCSACCFRNWRKLCEVMPCQDKERHINVSWHAVHVPENDVPTLLHYFKDNGGNVAELAQAKKDELFKFMESGHTFKEFKNKKYIDAWKSMGRS